MIPQGAKTTTVKYVQELAFGILGDTDRDGDLSAREKIVLRVGFEKLIRKLYEADGEVSSKKEASKV